MSNEIRIIPIAGIGEIAPGADLGGIIFAASAAQGLVLEPGDIFVVTQKIVSKAEDQIVHLATVEPSSFAQTIAEQYGKDPRHIEVVLRESKRIVRMDRGITICETRHGFICANAGVDRCNIADDDLVLLLPADPDQSARALRTRLQELAGKDEDFDIAVIISDTWGRPWRKAQVNMAIGVAGMEPMSDYRGQEDPYGYTLKASVIAVADELAGAAELVMGKIDQIPVALIRGYHYTPCAGPTETLMRSRSHDMFR